MKKELFELIDLQKVDFNIYALQQKRGKLPEEVNVLKNQEKALEQAFLAHKERIKEAEVARKNSEVELESNHEKIAKYDSQLNLIKSNDEYKAMLNQIAELKEKNDQLEENILIKMEELDQVKGQVADEEKKLATDKALLKEKEAELKKDLDAIDGQIAEFQKQRDGKKSSVSEKYLLLYDQILAKRKDRAIVPIVGDCCSACHMKLLAHVIDEAKGGQEVVTCDTCSRILYHEDNVPMESA